MSQEQLLEWGVYLPMILMAFTFHEYSHARVALALGDPTAADQGRVSLNPLVHVDIVGLIALLWFKFGWAKPVPVNPSNLHAAHPRNFRWAELAVAAAGPVSNLLLAGVLRLAILALSAFPVFSTGMLHVLAGMIVAGMIVNVGLFVLNLIPIYPLDGFTMLRNALPVDAAQRLDGTRPYGWILMALLMFFPQTGGLALLGFARDLLMVHLYRL